MERAKAVGGERAAPLAERRPPRTELRSALLKLTRRAKPRLADALRAVFCQLAGECAEESDNTPTPPRGDLLEKKTRSRTHLATSRDHLAASCCSPFNQFLATYVLLRAVTRMCGRTSYVEPRAPGYQVAFWGTTGSHERHAEPKN